ncbi:MAG: hybrid sensor histidine kinase/response regulator, partial [Bacteroidales bacterium]|nr:hybrid sensor histidine kinase/response regulator [Bacteroidales bacterium]
MKSLKLLLLTAVLCCICTLGVAQISVNRLSISDQLPSNSVNRLLQDSEGYIWMGTVDGLCRYDAYKVMIFGLGVDGGSVINCMAEDSCRRIWIGTKSGIYILDKRNYGISMLKDGDIQGKDIKCILTAKDGTVWVGAETSVYRFSAGSMQKTASVDTFVSVVNSFYEGNDGRIWLTTWQSGLYRADKDGNTFSRFPPLGRNDNPHKIYQDGDGQYWICTWGDGLYRFYPEKEKNRMYEHIDIPDKDSIRHENIFFNVMRDDKYGYIWALSHSGLYVLESDAAGKLTKADIPELWRTYTNLFLDFIKDRDGNFWLGTAGEGVLTIEFAHPRFHNYRLESIHQETGFRPNITAIYEHRDGTMWLRQNRLGICLFNPADGKILPFADMPRLNKLEGLKEVNCIAGYERMDEIWVGLEYLPVIYVFTQQGNKVSLKRRIDMPPDAMPPQQMMEDSQGNMWVLTTDRLFRKAYLEEELQEITGVAGNFTGMAEDADGAVCVGTSGQGLYRLMSDGEIVCYTAQSGKIPDNNIRAICTDANRRIWLATGDNRLFAFDIEQQTCRDYTRDSYLNAQTVYNMVTDRLGHLWISGNKRIVEFNPANGASTDYSSLDGIAVNSFNKNAVSKSHCGEILFGGNLGICAFTPENGLNKADKNPKALISDIKLNNHSIYGGNTSIDKRLTLNPEDKNIEIDFSSLNYPSSHKIRYAYMLEGVDKDWVYAGSHRQFAIYNQLQKGHYTFMMKATDSNGLWGTTVTRIEIIKLPVFYETWWAYLMYACVVAGCVYWLFRIFNNRMKLRHELVIAQIEKSKSEELMQTKLRYFTNISHDLLTPLTIMTCVIDDEEAPDTAEQATILRSNINRLRRLLQQILDFRKVESGNMKLKISHGDVASFIRNICYHNFLPLIKQQNIVFSFDAEPDHIQAYFDADKVDKIVFNLLSNAFKYTPKNGFISVRLQAKKNLLTVKVTDTGVGIPAGDIPNIFTRFYNNTMTAGETNGIGLSLTKDLVDLHRGSIWVESKPGEGATFTIVIPIDKESYSADQMSDANVTTAEIPVCDLPQDDEVDDNAGRQTDASILFVEDNEDLLDITAKMFSRQFKVHTAANGVKALEVMRDTDIDLVVSDVMMPE